MKIPKGYGIVGYNVNRLIKDTMIVVISKSMASCTRGVHWGYIRNIVENVFLNISNIKFHQDYEFIQTIAVHEI